MQDVAFLTILKGIAGIKIKKKANITNKSDEGYLFYSSKDVEHESQNLWYSDNGCSNHVTRECDIFISIDQSFNLQVKLKDGKMQKAVGKSTIVVHIEGCSKKLISDFFMFQI